MGLATAPAFAAAENTEYENSLKSGWGTNFNSWTYPTGYNSSFAAQLLRGLTAINTNSTNIYDRLGSINTHLGFIENYTNGIGTVATNTNVLTQLNQYWGTWAGGYSYPVSMSQSWYRLMFEGLNYTSASIDNIENIVSSSGITDISTNVAIIKDNTNVLTALPKIYDSVFAYRGRPNESISISTNNTTPRFLKWYKTAYRSYYLFDTANVNKPSDYYGIINNNLLGIASLLYSYNCSYTQNRYNGSGISTGTNDSISLADILYFGFEDNNKIVDYIASKLGHNISNITSAYVNMNNTTTSSWNVIGPYGVNYTDILKPIYIKWRNPTSGYAGIYGLSNDIENASLGDYLAVINSNIVNSFTAIYAPNKQYRKWYLDTNNISTVQNNAVSIADILDAINFDLDWFIQRYSTLYMDNDTLAAKQANQSQEQTVLTNFTGSGSASAGSSDFVAVKDSMSYLKSAASGSGSYTNAFNVLSGNSDGWNWFSQENANAMDTTSQNNRSGVRTNFTDDSNFPYLAAYYSELFHNINYNGIE